MEDTGADNLRPYRVQRFDLWWPYSWRIKEGNKEVNKKGMRTMEDYKLNTYADGFGVWHCKITYPGGIGNTWKAEAIAAKSMRAAKRAIRRAIVERSEPVKVKRLNYKVAANDSCSVNHLHSLTIAEA
jgi:hypothetical protein